MRASKTSWVVAAWLSLVGGGCADGCGGVDLCGQGYHFSQSYGGCVSLDAGGGPTGTANGEPDRRRPDDTDPEAAPQGPGPTADARPPEAPLDAHLLDASDADANAMDAGIEAGMKDAADDGEARPKDAGGDADAGVLEEAGMEDAEAGSPAGPACSEDDILAWSSFHLSASLLSTIDVCVSDPRCALGQCPLVQCMHDSAGLLDCEDCVAEETSCVFDACFDACKNSSTDAACLACACEAGCITLFEECTGTPLGVCNACAPPIAYCRGMHPWPALLVPILR